jgi:hypothetical protein
MGHEDRFHTITLEIGSDSRDRSGESLKSYSTEMRLFSLVQKGSTLSL